MEVIDSALRIQNRLSSLKNIRSQIGFVPTLGCLHAGHLALLQQARSECDIVIASVFINPLQFRKDKFEQYPRHIQQDIRIVHNAGVDLLFTPSVDEMFPHVPQPDDLFKWQVDEPVRSDNQFTLETIYGNDFIRVPKSLCNKMDGRLHPWHYDGVGTIVYKLFKIITPDFAYFGEKDPQQIAVVEAMVRQYRTPLVIRRVPTVREQDGLALSSRNSLLSPEQRHCAVFVAKALQLGIQRLEDGERQAGNIIAAIKEMLAHAKEVHIEYLSIVAENTLEEVKEVDRAVILYIAYNITGIRLTDNRAFSPIP